MSRLTDDLNTIASIKDDIKDAIQAKGVDMSGVLFSGYPSKIGEIQTGGGQKPEETLVDTITSNGSYNYSPQSGYVFDSASIAVDVHPSQALNRTYISNSTYAVSGEFNGATITVSVPVTPGPTISTLAETITSNGSYSFSAPSGYVYDNVSVSVNVQDYYTDTVEYLFGHCGSQASVFYYDSSDGGDYVDIIMALPSGWRASDITGSDSELKYTTSDSTIVYLSNPWSYSQFGDANVLSNTYTSDGGVIKFDRSLVIVENPFNYSLKSKITSMSFPSTVTKIGDNCLSNCDNLRVMNLPPHLVEIGHDTFAYNISLTKITIPASVTTIGFQAFRQCYTLTEVIVNATTPPTLGAYAFENSVSGRLIKVPAASLQAYKTAPGWSDYASQIVAQQD